MFGLFKRKKKTDTPDKAEPLQPVETLENSVAEETPVQQDLKQPETDKTPVVENNFKQPEKINIPDIKTFRQSKQAATPAVEDNFSQPEHEVQEEIAP